MAAAWAVGLVVGARDLAGLAVHSGAVGTVMGTLGVRGSGWDGLESSEWVLPALAALQYAACAVLALRAVAWVYRDFAPWLHPAELEAAADRWREIKSRSRGGAAGDSAGGPAEASADPAGSQ